MILSQLIRLVSTSPGDLVYHLVTLFAIEAILMLAISQGRRSGWQRGAPRVALAAGGLLLARCALVIVALLSAVGAANSAWIAPPLERFVAVASLGLLAWAFLPLLEDYPQAGLVLVVLNLMGGAILYAVFALQWRAESQLPGASFNATLADWAWNVWAAALALLALVAAMLRRRAQSGWLVAVFGLLLLGHVLHLGMAEAQTHIAGWVRLAELCAYPALVGLMMRRAIEREEAPPPLPSPGVTTPWMVIETCQRVVDASNVKVALQRAGVAISNVLSADVLAIGSLSDTGDAVELAAICRTGEPARSGPSFDLDSQVPIQSAISRQRAALVGADQEVQRATLAALVGGATGPLWVQPLIHQRATVGVLVVSRSHTTSSWTTGEAQTLNGLCGVLAAALSAARKAAALSRQVDELTQSARDREKALLQMQAEAQSSKEELRRLSAQVGRPRSADPVVRQREAMRPTLSVSQRPFFEQVTLHLERLDEARGRLVVSPGDSSAFSELVRATSALKEMSATTGYPTLAKLAGTLADALQRKDSGQSMTPGVLALVGESAQALRALLADAQADRSPGLDMTPLLGRLMSLPGAKSKEETRGTPSGAQTLLAQVRLNRDTPLKTARAMMVLMQIKRVGQIVACQPVEADIRSGGFEDQFAVTFTTSSKPESVRAALAAIPDVVDVQMSAA